ncbi:MAG: hypothetical protein FJZ61_04785 [Chlamydiae bacterium]|nr:hypothetical protein [Chlamydiota bacterium]
MLTKPVNSRSVLMESAVEKSEPPTGQKKISSCIYDYVICSLKSAAGVIPFKNTTPSLKTRTFAESQKYTAQKNVGIISRVCYVFFSFFGFFHSKLFKRTNVAIEKRGDPAINGPVVEKKLSAPITPTSIAANSKSTKKEPLSPQSTQSKVASETTKKELSHSLNTQSKATSEGTKRELLSPQSTQSKVASEDTKKELSPSLNTQATAKAGSTALKKDSAPSKEEPKKKNVSWSDSAMGERSECATKSIILRFPFAPPTKKSAEVQTDPPVEADLKPVNFPKAPKQERGGHHGEDFYIHPPRSAPHTRARPTPVRPPSPDLFDQTGDFFMGLVKDVSTVLEKLLPNSDRSVAASTRPPAEKETFFSL